MKLKELKVCIVIVTYNRKEYLIKLLEKLKSQTYKITQIVVFDNNSTDGTGDALKRHGFLDLDNEVLPIIYHKNDENLGGSGGFYNGIKLAMDYDYDLIWAMDDDVLPENNCLEELIDKLDEDTGICIPNRSGFGYEDYAITNVNMSNPFLYGSVNKKTKKYSDEIQGDTIKVFDMAFEGPLIRTSLIKKIGYPNKDLFILYDDSEYAMRASKIAIIKFVKNAHLYKQIIPTVNSDGACFTWKSYYDIRNGIWFDKMYGENIFVGNIRPIVTVLYWYVRLIKKHGFKYIKFVNKAYIDGIKSNLGKNIDPTKWS